MDVSQALVATCGMNIVRFIENVLNVFENLTLTSGSFFFTILHIIYQNIINY